MLDACCAPGGKTAHLLEAFDISLQALDSDAERLQRVEGTLERLGLSPRLSAADASEQDWWDGTPFDAILLDAPCSGSGVIRRHPDIKRLRRPDDIGQLAALQAKLLDNLWQTLAPGGTLVYATCSVLPEENAEQIAAFLERTPDAEATARQRTWPGDVSRAPDASCCPASTATTVSSMPDWLIGNVRNSPRQELGTVSNRQADQDQGKGRR